MALFVPWRPTYCARDAPAHARLRPLPPARPRRRSPGARTSLVFAAISMTVASAIASQLQRRVWRNFERANAQLAAADRMSSLGRMTAGIAHELKTPLAAVMNGLESIHSLAQELRESVGHPDVTTSDLIEIASEIGEVVRTSDSGARRAAQFVSAIRAQTVQMTDDGPRAVRDQGRGDERHHAARARPSALGHHDRCVRSPFVDRRDRGPRQARADRLEPRSQCARCVSRPAGHAHLALCEREPRQDYAHRRRTTAWASPEAHRGRIFDPLFTTKGAEEGTGLGLAISRDIAEGAFGGTLKLVPSTRGARFELCIPHEASRVSAPSGAWAPAQASSVSVRP